MSCIIHDLAQLDRVLDFNSVRKYAVFPFLARCYVVYKCDTDPAL